ARFLRFSKYCVLCFQRLTGTGPRNPRTFACIYMRGSAPEGAFMAVEEFLIQVDAGRFLSDAETRGGISVTEVPSRALQLDYFRADTLCQGLRRRGFRQAAVCNIVGGQMTYSEIQMALQAAASGPAQDPLPTTREEIDSMPAGEYRRRYKAEPAFAARVDELE